MIPLLTLRSRRTSRTAAALFATAYVLFASGAAFGALDLACVVPPTAQGKTEAPEAPKGCCGCSTHDHSVRSCCCGTKNSPGPGVSFAAVARCANPDSGVAGELTRVSPHLPGDLIASSALEFAPAESPAFLPLTSLPLSPPDKVPLAR